MIALIFALCCTFLIIWFTLETVNFSGYSKHIRVVAGTYYERLPYRSTYNNYVGSCLETLLEKYTKNAAIMIYRKGLLGRFITMKGSKKLTPEFVMNNRKDLLSKEIKYLMHIAGVLIIEI